MAEENTEKLKFGVDLDPKQVLRSATLLEKGMTQRFKKIQKSEEGVNKKLNEYIKRVGQSKRTFGPVLSNQLKLQQNTAKAISNARQEIIKSKAAVALYSGEVGVLRKEMSAQLAMVERLSKIDKDASDEQKKTASKELGDAKEILDQKKKALALKEKELKTSQDALKSATDQKKALGGALGRGRERAKQAAEQLKMPKNLFVEAAREGGTELLKPFASFARKDLAGFMKEGATLAISSLRGAQKIGKMKTDGAEMGGMLKMVGGLGKAISPLLDMVSKFAPMLKLAGSFALGLVQLFVGAEAAATDFNKEVLATSGSAGFLKRNAGDVTKSVRDSTEYMHDLYAQTAQVKNLMRGMSKEMQSATIAQLGAEGQDLPRLDRQLQTIRESSTTAAKSLTDMSDVTFQAIAYSRQFGVSLNEITQLQGEMMTEIGMGLTTVRTSFAEVDRAAEQAGVQAGKFFGIIRSFSADLSLFTLRMADVTKLMSVLGKTMSPRNAQKFLQTVSQQFKGASLMDRTRSVMLGGKGEMKGIAQGDMERRMAAMGADLSTAVGRDITAELQTKIKGGDTQEIAAFLSQFGDKISGAQAEAVFDAARMQSKLATNDTIDIASAIKDASPIAAIEMLQQISEKRFGKSLEDLTGVQRIAIENMAGINDEQIDQMYKMTAALLKTKTDLAHKLSTGAALTETETDMLKKLGVDAKSASAAQEVLGKDSNSIWNSMDTSQQDLLKSADKTEEFQTRTTSLQTSIADRMGQLVDFVITKFYTLVMSIYDAIMGLWDSFGGMFGVSGPSKEAKLQQQLTKGDVLAGFAKAAEEKAFLEERLKGTTHVGERKEIEDRLKVLEPLAKLKGTTKQDLLGLADKNISAGGRKVRMGESGAAKQIESWQAQIAAAGLSGGKAPSTTSGGGMPTESAQEDTTKSVDKVAKTLKKGVPLAKPSTDYSKAVEDSTLGAIRQGLFEYYMYSGLDRTMVSAGLASGAFTPANFGAQILGGAQEFGSPQAALANLVAPNAEGGIVASITNGAANVSRLPPGEGWASVGPGEKILPAGARGGGGGTTKIELELKGDLRRFVDARVVDGAANFERNKRLR